MHSLLFLKCMLSGFLLAAPIGPVNLICLKRTLSEGRLSGLAAGLGAALADALFAYVAAAGLHVFTDFLLRHALLLRWLGGLLIIYLGYRTFRSAVACREDARPSSHSLLRLAGKVFVLTLTNPLTIFAFLAVFSSLGIAGNITSLTATVLTALAVFAGSTLWWLTLTGLVACFRSRITDKVIVKINRLSGVLIILLGIVSLLEF